MWERTPDLAQVLITPRLYSDGGCDLQRRHHRERLGSGAEEVSLGGRVVSTRNGLLGHSKSGSSWGKTLRAHRAIRLERKLGRRKLSWKVESKFCWGSKGLRRGRTSRCRRRAQSAGDWAGGWGARRSPGAPPAWWGGPAGCRSLRLPGTATGLARGRHGGEPHPGADGAHRAL